MKCIIFLTVVALTFESFGAVVYGPGEAQVTRGDTYSAPFSTGPGSFLRFQQVFDGSDLFPGGSGFAYLIHGVYFRGEEGPCPIILQPRCAETITSPSVEIHVSTTGRTSDHLSTVFAENTGPNETVVFGPGSLTLSAPRGLWGSSITFSQPFLYDPSAGALLLDIRTYTTTSSILLLDTYDRVGDSVSSLISSDPSSAMGGALTSGLATLFVVDVVPVPEPSTTALLLLGTLALSWGWRRAKKVGH